MRKSVILIILSTFLGISGCEKWLTIQPDTLVTPEALFETPAGFKDALIGCYQLMEPVYGPYGPMISDEIEDLACTWWTVKGSINDKLTLHEYDNQSVDMNMGFVFRNMYKIIANVSELVRAIESQDGVLEEKLYAQYLGEALGLRAFVHLELIRLWGPMPSNVREEKLYLPFVEGIQISPYKYLTYNAYMKKIQADLDYAEHLLRNEMNTLSPQRSYMNYYAVLAIQARFHFWMGNEESALNYGNRLLEADTLRYFSLHRGSMGGIGNEDEVYQTAFINEAIFRYSFSSKNGVSLYRFAYENYVKSELFEGAGTDSRLKQWRLEMPIEGETEARMLSTKYSVDKAPDAEKDDLVYGYVPLIRISEIYFMLIELEATRDLARANELYGEFLEARGLAPRIFYSRAEVLNYLQLEYRREFIAEGQLFFAYKRWGVVNMPQSQRGSGESAYVPPIPRKEFELTN